ncbi:MAG: class I SAM-dependent rRNA methyltransferase [Betaproteobacteria bacterium]|nr:class I SAM-dependent rRNA methyltransferase [Betaproteobacteria bacterium]
MTPVATLELRPGKERSLQRRHPWIYAGAVARVIGRPAPGDLVRVVGADQRFLAWAAFSPESTIRARAWSFLEHEIPDDAWLSARVAASVARRAHLTRRTDAIRLVFGEADSLPGLIVDRYADQLVVQLMAAGVDARREAIVDALVTATGASRVYERSDAASRQREGLPSREGALRGAVPVAAVDIIEDGVRYQVDVVRGHKTGFYIDQRDNRRRLAQLAAGKRVLNCFCYTGGFSLAALSAGAAAAWSIDSSAEALAVAKTQQALNSIDSPAHWIQGDVFDALKRFAADGQRFDLIVLDPPKFAPSVQHLDRATRAYKQLSLAALRLLEPDGRLLTFSCSGAVSVDLFQKVVAGAVIDARVDAQMLERLAAGEDHPVSMTHPEGEYLKGLLLARL